MTRQHSISMFGLAAGAGLVTGLSLYQAQVAAGAWSGHIVFSEVQYTGESADQEFIELYNPTDNTIDLTGWRLSKRTSTGTQSNLIANMTGSVGPGSYLLIAHPNYTGATADLTYTNTNNSISTNNTLILYDAEGGIVDKLGTGSSADFEGTAAPNPEANQSLERKAHSGATSESMSSGADQLLGNGEDSDNNSSDFVIRLVPQPQNSQSAPEPEQVSPTPTPVPTTEPTPTPTPVPTPTPTPTASPTPTPVPTMTPVPTTTPSPTPVATATPIPSPTPTATPAPTVSPSPSPRPTPKPVVKRKLVCEWHYQTIRTMFFKLTIPVLSCQWR